MLTTRQGPNNLQQSNINYIELPIKLIQKNVRIKLDSLYFPSNNLIYYKEYCIPKNTKLILKLFIDTIVHKKILKSAVK